MGQRERDGLLQRESKERRDGGKQGGREHSNDGLLRQLWYWHLHAPQNQSIGIYMFHKIRVLASTCSTKSGGSGEHGLVVPGEQEVEICPFAPK